jgi:AcrR family transcriptional regulator
MSATPFDAERPARRPVRERLIDVADELFYAHGIHAVGIDRVLDQARVAKASLYTTFRSKDELVAAYLQQRSDAWREHVETEVAHRGHDATSRLMAVFDVLAESFDDPAFRGCPFINAAAEIADPSHPARKVIAGHRRWLHGLLAGIAAEAALPDAAQVATQLVLLYDGTLVGADLDGEVHGTAEAARDAVRRLVDPSP